MTPKAECPNCHIEAAFRGVQDWRRNDDWSAVVKCNVWHCQRCGWVMHEEVFLPEEKASGKEGSLP